MKRLWNSLVVALLAWAPPSIVANDELLKLQEDDKQWVMPGKDYAGTRYSKLNQINTENVKNLKAAWSFSTGVLRGHEGQPLVVGDTMYVHTPFPNIVYALDLTREGAPVKWKYIPQQEEEVVPIACCDTVNRGLAYAEGKIFLSQLDTHVVALDAANGTEIWKVKQGDYRQGMTLTSAPLVIKDKVISGISGGEFGVRGFVTANNINTGEQVWRMYSTGPADEVGYPGSVETWKGDEWKRGGGTTWGWYTYDPELDLLFYGTGNPGSWNPDQRPGDNKWSMTIFARNPDTGVASWAYQKTPHDAWDYDGVNENILVDQMVGGKLRKTLVNFDRNGFAYTVDRTNGELLVAEKFGVVNWATSIDLNTGRPVEVPGKRTSSTRNTKDIFPGAMGAKDQQPAAYSPKTGLFYVPTINVGMDYEGVEVKYQAGQPYVGAIVRMFPGPGGNRGEFIAWDAKVGEKKWGIKENLAAWSGALATSTNVVFYGTMEGWFKAVHAETGEVLWKFKTPSGIIGNPITYEGPDGKQYVAILSGVGGWAGIGAAAGIGAEDPTAGLGALGAFGDVAQLSNLGGVLMVFSL
ncbi:MAG: Methanol dehydrogenase [cytochrome c] subunit 1 [Candidatus Moanabacter tarae]|uniref:Methanol dehydrogenase [cytochrome c] subunit 1 n=1 Tax=Candidatus Moanibacter tarae TaxID=2200854 RepID=A0A2Z4AKP1_9BACT|nr:MAG: Methanol dehydrogenase [cytochrome c] subunit 1 [Candidatus Moanabacter tarae]|tara:strand:- start:9075 stop:10811 length:1737 start_codon:yes stop_codon:yes gene_type:complete